MKIILYQPQIPQNAGNIVRTCAVTGSNLVMVKPLGFSTHDRWLKRAGLDYWEFVDLSVHKSWQEFLTSAAPQRVWFFSKRAELSYTQARYGSGDYLVFGPETRGLPAEMLAAHAEWALRIPMMGSGVRSLNLSNAVSIVLYEALRQLGRT